MRKLSLGYVLFAFLVVGALAAALTLRPPQADARGGLPSPQGPVILTVTGNITNSNSAVGAQFDRAMLEELGITMLRTTTPWTEGVPAFKGVLARAVLERVGAKGKTVRAVALNDYAFEIAASDFHEYQVILASEMNGQELTPRDKGPLWIMYPLDSFSGREKQEVELRLVWQLSELHVQ